MPTDARAELVEANHRFYAALNAMFAGDPEPFADVYSHADDVSYLPAQGGVRVGWDATWADWRQQAAAARGGSAEIVQEHAIAGSDMGATQTEITGQVTGPDGRTHRVHARETSVYRREDGRWRIVAHQADAIPEWVEVVDTG